MSNQTKFSEVGEYFILHLEDDGIDIHIKRRLDDGSYLAKFKNYILSEYSKQVILSNTTLYYVISK